MPSLVYAALVHKPLLNLPQPEKLLAKTSPNAPFCAFSPESCSYLRFSRASEGSSFFSGRSVFGGFFFHFRERPRSVLILRDLFRGLFGNENKEGRRPFFLLPQKSERTKEKKKTRTNERSFSETTNLWWRWAYWTARGTNRGEGKKEYHKLLLFLL